jgi:hypothetical protein
VWLYQHTDSVSRYAQKYPYFATTILTSPAILEEVACPERIGVRAAFPLALVANHYHV